jgi:hypothetical protein
LARKVRNPNSWGRLAGDIPCSASDTLARNCRRVMSQSDSDGGGGGGGGFDMLARLSKMRSDRERDTAHASEGLSAGTGAIHDRDEGPDIDIAQEDPFADPFATTQAVTQAVTQITTQMSVTQAVLETQTQVVEAMPETQQLSETQAVTQLPITQTQALPDTLPDTQMPHEEEEEEEEAEKSASYTDVGSTTTAAAASDGAAVEEKEEAGAGAEDESSSDEEEEEEEEEEAPMAKPVDENDEEMMYLYRLKNPEAAAKEDEELAQLKSGVVDSDEEDRLAAETNATQQGSSSATAALAAALRGVGVSDEDSSENDGFVKAAGDADSESGEENDDDDEPRAAPLFSGEQKQKAPRAPAVKSKFATSLFARLAAKRGNLAQKPTQNMTDINTEREQKRAERRKIRQKLQKLKERGGKVCFGMPAPASPSSIAAAMAAASGMNVDPSPSPAAHVTADATTGEVVRTRAFTAIAADFDAQQRKSTGIVFAIDDVDINDHIDEEGEAALAAIEGGDAETATERGPLTPAQAYAAAKRTEKEEEVALVHANAHHHGVGAHAGDALIVLDPSAFTGVTHLLDEVSTDEEPDEEELARLAAEKEKLEQEEKEAAELKEKEAEAARTLVEEQEQQTQQEEEEAAAAAAEAEHAEIVFEEAEVSRFTSARPAPVPVYDSIGGPSSGTGAGTSDAPSEANLDDLINSLMTDDALTAITMGKHVQTEEEKAAEKALLEASKTPTPVTPEISTGAAAPELSEGDTTSMSEADKAAAVAAFVDDEAADSDAETGDPAAKAQAQAEEDAKAREEVKDFVVEGTGMTLYLWSLCVYSCAVGV